jgi:spermidine synthase
LFLGTGTGVTFGAAGVYPDLKADGVELVPEVIEVMDHFEPENLSAREHPRLKLYQADARRFVRSTPNRYDVIVADLFHPARDGAGSLYTREHFRAIQSRLADGGLFCQWLPLHQLSGDTLKLIARTFLDVFPTTYAYLLRFNIDTPVLGLVGYLHPPQYTSDWVESRMSSTQLNDQLKGLRLTDTVRLLGCLAADPASLKRFAGNGPLNTDSHPRVTFVAPGFAYQKAVVPYDRLFDLLQSSEVRVKPLLSEAGSKRIAFERRITDFVRARNVYLEGLVKQDNGELSEAIDSYVRSARLSRDFTLGYARCLSYATALAAENPEAARTLLRRLAEAQPDRPVADQLLQRLFRN